MITSEQVKHIAKLARIAITDRETEAFTKQIDAILAYVEKLDTIDTEGIEPTALVTQGRDSMRDDEVKRSLPREKLLGNGPSIKKDCFAVPQILAR